MVSDVKLEVNELANCPQTGPDDADYSNHFSGVDSRSDTTMLAHAWYSSGVRIFDVRDPTRPREIAYYNPPPQPDTVFEPRAGGRSFDAQTPEWDATTSRVRFRGNGEIWFVSIANGFQIVKLQSARAGDGDDDGGHGGGDEPDEPRRHPGDGGREHNEAAPLGDRGADQPPRAREPVEANLSAGLQRGDAAEAQDDSELPFTGFGLALIALAAVMLLMGGSAVRTLVRSRGDQR